MNPPTIYILGAGAIGLTFAYFLRQAGIHVTLILSHQEKLALFQQQNGFYYQFEDQIHFITCDALLATQLSRPIDHLIICTKAFDVIAAFNSVQDVLNEKTKILICHNGLGIQQQVQNKWPSLSTCFAITTIGACSKKPFDVVMKGFGNTILENALFNELLQDTILTISVEADFKKMAWQKFAINCAINPLTTIYQCYNGELLQSDHAKYLMREILCEIIDIARCEQLEFELESLCQQLFLVANGTATNYSSMLQDVTRQQKTEVDYLNGYVVALAKRHHKSVPFNLILTNIIQRLHHDNT